MFTDFVLNGQASGPVGELIQGVRFDPGMLRPYFDDRGVACVTVNSGRMVYNHDKAQYEPKYVKVPVAELQKKGITSPVFNATSLRKEDWIQLDKRVQLAARQRLRAWTDLASRSSIGGFNAMAKMTYEYEAMSDPGEAIVDMDGIAQGRTDSPLFKLRSVPLPITFSKFWFSERRLAVSRNSGMPLNIAQGEAAARRVAEMIEQTLIGEVTGVTYGTQSAGVTAHDGNSTQYGYKTFPPRLTKTDLTVPTGSNPEATVQDVLEMRQQLLNNRFYGPWMLYHSTDWDTYLDNDYARLGGSNANMTLRDRLRKIDGIEDVRRLDFLDDTFTLLMVQMTSDVAEAIDGMPITTFQYEELGGWKKCFMVAAIQVALLKKDYNDRTGILHATTA